MTSPLPPALRKNLTSWLHYFDDLHLGGFYLDRQRAARRADNLPAGSGPVVLEVPPMEILLAPKPSVPTPSIPSPQPILPIVQRESIFDQLDRLEGDSLERIREDLGECTRCRLHKRRTKLVFGVGNAHAKLVFVGEGPGHDEDIQGEPFVGRAGKLLTQMIEAMGITREDVYICNVVKCRPPENRKPEDDEVAICSPYLYRQIDVIAPKAIVGLGAVAVQALLKTKDPISRYRGQWFDFRGVKLMPTYHPAYLLRNPAAKGEVWKDLQKVMEFLGLLLKKRPRAGT